MASVVTGLCFLLVSGVALAQSSGNFTYGSTGNNSTGCVLLQNGALSGGYSNCSVSSIPTPIACVSNAQCLSILGGNSGATCVNSVCVLPNAGLAGCNGSVSAGLKTSSGQGNVFDVRISAVIGLLTDVTISSKEAADQFGTTSSSALAGIDFQVDVKPESGQPAPYYTPSYPITYDARFVQISTNLFQGLVANCTAATNGCFLTFAESTVSAHSFDWIVGAPTAANPKGTLFSGQYGLTASWGPSTGFAVSGIGEAAACVGPVNFTVQQNKIFSFNTVNSL